MGKDLKGKELGKGISQESTGLYSARFFKNPKEFRFAEVWNIVTVQRSGVSENQRVNQVTVRYP